MALEKIVKNSSGVPTGEYERIAGGTLYADSPIATILPYGGITAPSGWMICDGASLLRASYPDLFAVIGTAFGSADSTHFNIPDLRGEFLRGAGTNSHSGQGNGGNVGDHQDATTVPNVYKATGGDQVLVASGVSALFQNEDASVAETSGSGYATITMSKSTSTDVPSHYMTRPTNTSVNYIIKAKMTAVPADFMAKVDEIYGDIIPSDASASNKLVTENTISNPNLFDNPWFTVNQRGITNDWTTQFAYGVDRWRKQTSATNTLQITDNGISATTSSVIGIYQVFKQADVKDLYGRILTFSVMYGDGTIESGSGLLPLDHYLPSSTKQKQFLSNTTKCNYVQTESYSSGNLNIVVNTKAGTTIKAVKLELGSVSTLAMDTAPNYASELLKCQRYCYVLSSGVIIAINLCARADSTGTVDFQIPLPCVMRAQPTASMPDGVPFGFVQTGAIADMTEFTSCAYVFERLPSITNIAVIRGTKTGAFTENSTYKIGLKANTKLILSADL